MIPIKVMTVLREHILSVKLGRNYNIFIAISIFHLDLRVELFHFAFNYANDPFKIRQNRVTLFFPIIESNLFIAF